MCCIIIFVGLILNCVVILCVGKKVGLLSTNAYVKEYFKHTNGGAQNTPFVHVMVCMAMVTQLGYRYVCILFSEYMHHTYSYI